MCDCDFERIANDAIAMYKEKSNAYGYAYRDHGKVMMLLFPDGIELKTEADFSRFSLFNELIKKLTRYSKSVLAGGHQDSIRDAGVYSFMLEELDELFAESYYEEWAKEKRNDDFINPADSEPCPAKRNAVAPNTDDYPSAIYTSNDNSIGSGGEAGGFGFGEVLVSSVIDGVDRSDDET